MADPNSSYSRLDDRLIFQRAFDESTDRLRVDAEVTATVGTMHCIIRAQDGDSIIISDGTNNLKITPNNEALVKAVALDSLDSKLNDDYGIRTKALRTASQIGNINGPADFASGPTTSQTLRISANTSDGQGNIITSTQFQSKQALDVNILSILQTTQSPLPASNASTVFKYNEAANVASGATSTVLTYTVPSGKKALLQRILVGGENIAKYQTIYNSSLIATKRTYFQNLNEEFNFIENSNNGFLMQAGDIITITVLQTRPWSANFESTIQVVEIT